MKNLVLFLSFSIATLCSCTAQPKQTIDSQKVNPKIDALVQAYTNLDIFSGVVLVKEKGNEVYKKAFGLANRSTQVANSTATRFDIGSMNKTFTKVLILQLVDEGKLRLNDKLNQYLKGFTDAKTNEITIAHLLSHESGFGDYYTPNYINRSMKEKTIPQVVEHIKKLPLLFPPGKEMEYSNAGYVLLGAIAEKVTGKSYYDLIEQRILQPLELQNTFVREKYTVPNRAIGYFKTPEGEIQDNEFFQEWPTPDGGFYSTVNDIQTFYHDYFYGNILLSKKAKSFDPGFPFYQDHQNSGGAIPHAGGFNGANTVSYTILRDQISVIIFANMDEPVAEDLGKGILAIIRGKQPEKPVLPANQAVFLALQNHNLQYVKDNWEDLTQNFHPTDPKDLILNNIGYHLLQSGQPETALKAFQLNTELFPNIANCWDSYGEALLALGKQEASLKAYQKALNINPSFQPSLEALARIKKMD